MIQSPQMEVLEGGYHEIIQEIDVVNSKGGLRMSLVWGRVVSTLAIESK